MLTPQSVLVVAPHPDDETLGAGGTLLKLAERGAELHWLLLTTAKGAGYSDDYIATQKRQVAAVKDAYPFSSLTWLANPAARLNESSRVEMVDAVRSLVKTTRPELVLLPHAHDAHDDQHVQDDADA